MCVWSPCCTGKSRSQRRYKGQGRERIYQGGTVTTGLDSHVSTHCCEVDIHRSIPGWSLFLCCRPNLHLQTRHYFHLWSGFFCPNVMYGPVCLYPSMKYGFIWTYVRSTCTCEYSNLFMMTVLFPGLRDSSCPSLVCYWQLDILQERNVTQGIKRYTQCLAAEVNHTKLPCITAHDVQTFRPLTPPEATLSQIGPSGRPIPAGKDTFQPAYYPWCSLNSTCSASKWQPIWRFLLTPHAVWPKPQMQLKKIANIHIEEYGHATWCM